MTSAPNDIVITGLGVVSPIGIGREAFWESLAAGRGGIRLTQPTEPVSGRRWMAGEYEGFDPKQYVQPRKIMKVMCLEAQAAFAAAVLACREAGLEAGKINSDRLGTVFGSEMYFSENEDIRQIVELCRQGDVMNHAAWGASAMANMYPLWMLKSLPNMPACHIGIWLDARGPNNTLTTEETSSLTAMIEAAHVIKRGQADCMLVGVSGNRASLTRLLQRHESQISKAYDDPAQACKPFDVARDGTVMAMGASVLVLEKRSHAEARGTIPLAKLSSWSSTFGRPTGPYQGSSDAVRRAIAQTLERGRITAKDLDHINACANGVITGDANEAAGIRAAAADVPVVSIKGFIGDSGSSSGLLELSASLCGLRHNRVPYTLNHRETAKDCPINVISGSVKALEKPYFIKTVTSPYGQAAAVLIENETT